MQMPIGKPTSSVWRELSRAHCSGIAASLGVVGSEPQDLEDVWLVRAKPAAASTPKRPRSPSEGWPALPREGDRGCDTKTTADSGVGQRTWLRGGEGAYFGVSGHSVRRERGQPFRSNPDAPSELVGHGRGLARGGGNRGAGGEILGRRGGARGPSRRPQHRRGSSGALVEPLSWFHPTQVAGTDPRWRRRVGASRGGSNQMAPIPRRGQPRNISRGHRRPADRVAAAPPCGAAFARSGRSGAGARPLLPVA